MVITRRPTLELAAHAHQNGQIYFQTGSTLKNGPLVLLTKAASFAIVGVLFIIWTPLEILMDERLRMHRFLPPYEMWATPPDMIALKVRVFNYTNLHEFIEGKAQKLHVEEVGPIIYKERFTHTNITRNDNETITYVARHEAIYHPEMNNIDLNATIIVPNYAVLAIASFLADAPFFIKMGLTMLIRRLKTPLVREISIQHMLWNFTDPILDVSHSLAPMLAPIRNIGMLHRVYEDFEDTVTMYIGTTHGNERFSLIDKFGGTDNLPNYKHCKDKLTNATEGVTYAQMLTKDSTLRYWRKTICKAVDLHFQNDLRHGGINAYKYTVPPTSFDRTHPLEDDCYKGGGKHVLPNGLTDVSNCMFNVPIVASFPHFLYGSEKIRNPITGLKPNASAHESFVIAEPITGVPLESMARSQSNMAVPKLYGMMSSVQRFSDIALPMFWLEYHQYGVPFLARAFIFLLANFGHPAQILFILFLFVVSFVYVVLASKKLMVMSGYKQLLLHNSNLRNVQLQQNDLKLIRDDDVDTAMLRPTC